jgi:hypothetical protein
MSERIDNVCNSLAAVAAEAKEDFGSLSVAQLNWKPAATSWSIAQCFDHLITTHSLYFPLFERLAEGETRMSWWENFSPLSGFFGRYLIKGLDPKNVKPMKTTSRGHPSASEIGGDIIERFRSHQSELIDHLRKLPETIDVTNRVITSPMMGLVTYTLDDTFTIIDFHCRRHFNQAKRVMENTGFQG